MSPTSGTPPQAPRSAAQIFESSIDEIHRAGLETWEIVERYWRSIHKRPVVPRVTPRELDALFDEPLPEEPMPLSEVVREVARKVEPFVTAMGHPRFFAY